MSDRRYGVLIGNSHFPNEDKLQDLRCPANDVDGLNELLLSQLHGGFTETFVLKDRPHYEVLLKINQVLKQRDKSDLVFIYYSGHGKLDLANRLHLCTADTTIDALEATSVPVQSIKNFIDVSPSTQVALVLDCCFSGAVGTVFARSGVDDQLQLMSGGRGTYIMSASTAVQVALEKEGDENSIFTTQVIEGIRSGAADVNGDGIVTMDELYKYVHDQVLAEGFQEPEKWGINVRGELVIARTSKTPRADRRRQIRDVLLDLASQNILPDRVLTKAMEVIALQRQQLSPELEAGDHLLDRLVQKEIGVGEFIDEWYKLNLPRVSAGARQQPVSSERAATKPQPQPEPKRPPPDTPRAPEPAEPSRVATSEGTARSAVSTQSPGWPTTGYLFLTAIYWTIAAAVGGGVWGEVDSSAEMSSMAFVGAVAAAIYGAGTGLVFRWAKRATEWRGVLSLGITWGVVGAVGWAVAEANWDDGGPVLAAVVAAIVGATWGGVMIWRLTKARGQGQPVTGARNERAGTLPPPSIRRATAYGALAGLSAFLLGGAGRSEGSVDSSGGSIDGSGRRRGRRCRHHLCHVRRAEFHPSIWGCVRLVVVGRCCTGGRQGCGAIAPDTTIRQAARGDRRRTRCKYHVERAQAGVPLGVDSFSPRSSYALRRPHRRILHRPERGAAAALRRSLGGRDRLTRRATRQARIQGLRSRRPDITGSPEADGGSNLLSRGYL